jgi:ribosomal protein L16 Arg81 hydroxylase
LLLVPSSCVGGSYTAPHLDFYGADAYVYLVSGEKLWILAPPEKVREFDAMFKNDQKAATIRFTKEQKQYMLRHQIRVVHQKAGDIIFISGGWPHLVKNLTDTVSFGNSYLRPWRMEYFFDFLKMYGLDQAQTLVNVKGVVREWMTTERQREWGLSSSYVQEVMQKWAPFIRRHSLVEPDDTAC